MFRRVYSQKRLSLESLEPRLAMAGDVAAYLGLDRFGFETVLVVEGDVQANEVRVVEDALGHARIEGLNGTTVNVPVIRDTRSGWAQSINDLGEVVGTLLIHEQKYGRYNRTPHAYLWRDGEPIDLEKEIPANSGWSLLQDGFVNNNLGVIGGSGNFNGNGGQGFLLVPSALSSVSATSIPEPTPLTLTLLCFAGAVISRCRSRH